MPFQLWMEFLTELEKYNPKFDMESQMTSNSQNNLQKKKKKAKLKLSQFLIKLYYKTIVIKNNIQCCYKKKQNT